MNDDMADRRRRLSLHPLSPEEALADLLKVKPAAKAKTVRQRPKAARTKAKKKKYLPGSECS